MNLEDVVGHGAPSGAAAQGVFRWMPAGQAGTEISGMHPKVTNAIHGISVTAGEQRTDYLVGTGDNGFTIVAFGMKATFFRWSQAESAEIWYW